MTSRVDGADDDSVLLFDPDEPIVTFYFKLPEPINVPDHTIFPEHLHASALPLGWLESGIESERDEEDRGIRNMSNVWVVGSSTLVHHIKIGLVTSLGLDAVMKAVLAGTEKSPQPDFRGQFDDHSADCTVLEVSLPAWTNLTFHGNKESAHGVTTFDARDLKEISGIQIDTLFEMAIERVRHLQTAYNIVHSGPLTLLTPETLPPLIPFLVRTSAQIAAKEVGGLELYQSMRAFNAITRGPDLSPKKLAKINHAGEQVAINPLAAYRDLDREAVTALRRFGNTRVSVMMAAMSAEVILDRTLLLLCWEEGRTPEDVASTWRESLKSRVELDLASRLGGSWDLTSGRPIGHWAKKVAQVRNRVVHAGYRPSLAEAEEALRASRGLVTFFGDRLAHANNLKRYTRSALLLAGKEGLTRRGCYTKAVNRMHVDPRETSWPHTFGMWYTTFNRLRADRLDPRQPRLDRAELLFVYHPNDWPKYIAHDNTTGLAVEVAVPDHVDLRDSREQVQEIFTAHSQSDHRDNPVSVAIVGGIVPGIYMTGSWVEEYHLVPLRGVMVDKSDFTAPGPLESRIK